MSLQINISYEEILKMFNSMSTEDLAKIKAKVNPEDRCVGCNIELEQEDQKTISSKVADLLEKMKAKVATIPDVRYVSEDEKEDDDYHLPKPPKERCYTVNKNGLFDCKCGSTVIPKSIYRHYKSRKHEHWVLQEKKKIEI